MPSPAASQSLLRSTSLGALEGMQAWKQSQSQFSLCGFLAVWFRMNDELS